MIVLICDMDLVSTEPICNAHKQVVADLKLQYYGLLPTRTGEVRSNGTLRSHKNGKIPWLWVWFVTLRVVVTTSEHEYYYGGT